VAPTFVDRAIGWRHGVVADATAVPTVAADFDVANWGATTQPLVDRTAAGGVGYDDDSARAAAVAEAVERYVAVLAPLPVIEPRPGDLTARITDCTLHSRQQQDAPGFPYAAAYDDAAPLTRAWRVTDGRPACVPLGLVTLDPARSVIATSSGLAAAATPIRALLRAVQELVERDALMTTWLHGVAARQVPLPERLLRPVRERDGDVTCFDLTPAWSPHPVAAVAGNAPLRGRPRLSLGLACRARFTDAVEKAWLEWTQGTVFAGGARWRGSDAPASPSNVTDFDRHAAYYSSHPDEWAALPIWRGDTTAPPPDAGRATDADELQHLVHALAAAGIELYYRDLTTVDAARIGLRVVRALAPSLTPIHGDHRWPHLGGRAADLAFRYPWAAAGSAFPNPAPHPLG
jgi:ribosomal protein S12 methylthiotransferase accessory factor